MAKKKTEQPPVYFISPDGTVSPTPEHGIKVCDCEEAEELDLSGGLILTKDGRVEVPRGNRWTICPHNFIEIEKEIEASEAIDGLISGSFPSFITVKL